MNSNHDVEFVGFFHDFSVPSLLFKRNFRQRLELKVRSEIILYSATILDYFRFKRNFQLILSFV